MRKAVLTACVAAMLASCSQMAVPRKYSTKKGIRIEYRFQGQPDFRLNRSVFYRF